MNPKWSTPHKHARRRAPALCVLALLALACSAALGQDGPAGRQQEPDDAAPPPMRHIPEELRARLAAARDDKARTRLSIELAEERLASAAAHADAGRFDAATGEIGVYEALIKDVVKHLQRDISGRVPNKKRDLFKRVELALRTHLTRIESIRRTLPAHYVANFKNSLEFVRSVRSDALNAFYSDTVMPGEVDRGTRTPEGERAGGAESPKPDKEKKPQQPQQQ
jgi:hypothetical protein